MNLKKILKKETDYLFVHHSKIFNIFPVLCFGYEWCSPKKKESNFKYRKSSSLHFVLNGEGTIVHDGKTYNVKRGQCFLLSENDEYIYYGKKSNPWLYIWIDFKNVGNAANLVKYAGFAGDIFIKTLKNFEEIEEKIVNLFKENKSYENLHYQAEALSVFTMLIENQITENKRINEIIDYVDNNFKDQSLNVSSIADHFGISSAHLSRIFKQETNQNLVSYIVNYRLEEATHLLKRGISVKKVANLTGFDTDSYFCNLFKKKYGVTPKQYKERNL